MYAVGNVACLREREVVYVWLSSSCGGYGVGLFYWCLLQQASAGKASRQLKFSKSKLGHISNSASLINSCGVSSPYARVFKNILSMVVCQLSSLGEKWSSFMWRDLSSSFKRLVDAWKLVS